MAYINSHSKSCEWPQLSSQTVSLLSLSEDYVVSEADFFWYLHVFSFIDAATTRKEAYEVLHILRENSHICSWPSSLSVSRIDHGRCRGRCLKLAHYRSLIISIKHNSWFLFQTIFVLCLSTKFCSIGNCLVENENFLLWHLFRGLQNCVFGFMSFKNQLVFLSSFSFHFCLTNCLWVCSRNTDLCWWERDLIKDHCFLICHFDRVISVLFGFPPKIKVLYQMSNTVCKGTAILRQKNGGFVMIMFFF